MNIRDHLAYLIASVNKQLEDELQDRLRAIGMPIEQLRILEALSAAHRLPMGELASAALLAPTTLTKIIDRMVAEGLVVRMPDAQDRRRVVATLAPAGKAALRHAGHITSSQEARIKKRMPKEKLVELRSLLRGLAAG